MSKVKVAICQFGLRDTHSYDEMADHLREQCLKALESRPDLVLFPEFTAFGLLGMAEPGLRYADLRPALEKFIAGFTPAYEALFTQLAQESGAVIVGGSHWIQEEQQGPGFNTAHLFFPDGAVKRQKKNHLFPGENRLGHLNIRRS